MESRRPTAISTPTGRKSSDAGVFKFRVVLGQADHGVFLALGFLDSQQ